MEVKVIDQNIIHLYFKDGEATFVDDGNGACPHDHCEDLANNDYVPFGNPLNTANAQNNGNYSISSSDDANFSSGVNPTSIYRKSKMANMVWRAWTGSDYSYDWGLEHQVFLSLPQGLEHGKTYTIAINDNTETDQTSITFTYDIFETRSEAIKVNVVGYDDSDAIKAADLYYWMGDGGDRDFSSFQGNKVYLVNTATDQTTEVSTVSFGANEGTETRHGHQMLKSDVWHVDFTGFNTPGTYKLAIEGIGCSDEFTISSDIYRDPYMVSVQGFFYMRIGQTDYAAGKPVPRKPLWIPDSDPANSQALLAVGDFYTSECRNRL